MRYRLRTLLIPLAIGIATGCAVGGKPGAFHVPPSDARFEEQIVLEWKYIIRGDVGAGAGARYSDEAVFYRTNRDASFRAAPIKRVQSDNSSVTIQAVIPPISPEAGDTLEYFETHLFDGRPTEAGNLDNEKQFVEINAANPYCVKLTKREPLE